MSEQTQAVKVNPLEQGQRDKAYETARLRIAGAKPQAQPTPLLEDFYNRVEGRYPNWITYIITGLTIVLLVAAFLPSAMRLHEVGLKAAKVQMNDTTSQHASALSTVMLAEIGQVIFSLAAVAAFTRTQSAAFYIGAIICTAIALTGNHEASKRTTWTVFVVLETFAPPVIVLLTAQVLKTQMLDALSTRQAAQAEHRLAVDKHESDERTALSDWESAYADAHRHERWSQELANALRDALYKANAKTGAERLSLRSLTDNDWRAFVVREIQAEEWFKRSASVRSEPKSQPQPETQVQPQPKVSAKRKPSQSGNLTGEAVNAVLPNVDGTHTATCPHCQRAFRANEPKSAVNALTAHLRHCASRKLAENAAQPIAHSANGNAGIGGDGS